METLKKFMAARCEYCPLCRYARGKPETLVGRVMYWHGKWCPFWKAWEERYGQAKRPEKP